MQDKAASVDLHVHRALAQDIANIVSGVAGDAASCVKTLRGIALGHCFAEFSHAGSQAIRSRCLVLRAYFSDRRTLLSFKQLWCFQPALTMRVEQNRAQD